MQEIAKVKFPFPNEEFPELEAIVNIPKPYMAIPGPDGKDITPDIVVVRRPGTWLKIMAYVETEDTVNDESAVKRWLPASKVGDLVIYVPFGCAMDAKKLCKKHGVKTKGIRMWRFRPVWGLDVSEA